MKLIVKGRRRAYSFDPLPEHSQPEQRTRRRSWLAVEYDARFSLADEIAAIVEPLAGRVAADPIPTAYENQVADLAEAVHRCITELGDLALAAADHGRVAHLVAEDRKRALNLLHSRRAGQSPIEVDAAALKAGSWYKSLVEAAQPVSVPLKAFLGRKRATTPSASQLLEAELRQLDRVALTLERRLDRREFDREQFNVPETTAPTTDDLLAELGVKL